MLFISSRLKHHFLARNRLAKRWVALEKSSAISPKISHGAYANAETVLPISPSVALHAVTHQQNRHCGRSPAETEIKIVQKFILNLRTLVLFLGYMSNDEEVCRGDWLPLGKAQSGF
jgi:hypothetical protein